MLKPVGSNHIGSGKSSRCWVLSISLFNLSSFLLSPVNWVTWLFIVSGQDSVDVIWNCWRQGFRWGAALTEGNDNRVYEQRKDGEIKRNIQNSKNYGQIMMFPAHWGGYGKAAKVIKEGIIKEGQLRTEDMDRHFVKSSNIKPLLEIEVFLWIAQALWQPNYLRANVYAAVNKL